MAEEAVASGGVVSRWVTFSLDDEVYGVHVMGVREVLPMTDIAPVPGAPPHVLGIINLRGDVVTVIDTRRRFGLVPRESDDATRIVVIETEGQVAGIMVDSVSEVVEIEDDHIDTTPNVGTEDSARYIRGVVSRDEKLLILVDVERLLTREEWQELAEL